MDINRLRSEFLVPGQAPDHRAGSRRATISGGLRARDQSAPVSEGRHQCMADADGTCFAHRLIVKSHRTLVPVLVAGVLLASVPARADEPTLEAIPRLGEGEHFTIDPVVDGLLTVGGATFAELLSLILSTGEIRPSQPGSSDVLLSIDRVAVTQTIDPNAAMRSNFGLYTAYAYAVLDPILSGVRDGRRALLVDAIMYAESIAITQAFTSAT